MSLLCCVLTAVLSLVALSPNNLCRWAHSDLGEKAVLPSLCVRDSGGQVQRLVGLFL